ncbi:hypothetical protein FPZ42_07000 [Mucilaginibacter achroorhodeus]|uniref:Uncharacterized protein n=1 Tax=Mucilaginibacter achroorhodeus TaxID=2599294 RepID=A0A563U601_9SPHI|nr:hypothetical protein [Mucilaginibacter achroorhodeus]TWR26778.1 hypothetical protein FPZ42_07000 [Mucilaginibacter achroorhodeus]
MYINYTDVAMPPVDCDRALKDLKSGEESYPLTSQLKPGNFRYQAKGYDRTDRKFEMDMQMELTGAFTVVVVCIDVKFADASFNTVWIYFSCSRCR